MTTINFYIKSIYVLQAGPSWLVHSQDEGNWFIGIAHNMSKRNGQPII